MREGGNTSLTVTIDCNPEGFTTILVERVRWEHIQKALKQNNGHTFATAGGMDTYRRTLQRKPAKQPVAE